MAAVERAGNWTPEGKAEVAALRRDYRELTPAQRAEQVMGERHRLSPMGNRKLNTALHQVH